MKFSEQALDSDFFRIANRIIERSNKGELVVLDDNSILSKHLCKGEFIITANDPHPTIKVRGKRIRLNFAIGVLKNKHRIYNVEDFLRLWHKGTLGSLYKVSLEMMVDCFKYLLATHELVSYDFLYTQYGRLLNLLENRFTSLRRAYEYVGTDYDKVLLQSSQISSSQGLLFENVIGEILDHLNYKALPQHDLKGDGSTRIDYYLKEGNIGYECKLSDHTVFQSQSLNKYPELLNTLYIVYLKDTGKTGSTLPENTEFLSVYELLERVEDKTFVEIIKGKLDSLLSVEIDLFIKNCSHCNKEFKTEFQSKQYCTDSCKQKAHYKRNPRPKQEILAFENQCVSCGTIMVTKYENKKYCDQKCRNARRYNKVL